MAPTTLRPTRQHRPPPAASGTLRTLICLVALAAISVVSRLPQLRSPNLLVDGDECVLGLMAKHVAQGKEFPVFFYGQHYALETVEAGAGALGFRALRRQRADAEAGDARAVDGRRAVLVPGAVESCWASPESFWITAVLDPESGVGRLVDEGRRRIHHVVHRDRHAALAARPRAGERETVARWLIAGALTALIYLAQPLWLPGVLPILLVVLASRRRLSWGVGISA